MDLPDYASVRTAAQRIRACVLRTPVLTNPIVDAATGAELFFKCENLQSTGAFKLRGASNAVQLLDARTAARGVATHSSGNHGAALAAAAARRGIEAHVVMPTSAPATKRANVLRYGATVHDCEPTLAAREARLAEVVDATGAHVVHPYDDARVIAGQGTAALELLQEQPGLDLVLVPIGGGGLAAGTALAVKGRSPGTRVMAVEPSGADDAWRSWQSGRHEPSIDPDTIADGLLTSVGERNMALLRRHLDGIVTVDDAAIIAAMRILWTELHLVVEPSAAVPFAALSSAALDVTGQRVGIIISGGNVDLDRLPWQARAS